jgi:hypothetical protein
MASREEIIVINSGTFFGVCGRSGMDLGFAVVILMKRLAKRSTLVCVTDQKHK